jgi:hypothetical protein
VSDPKFDVDKIQRPALDAIWTVSFNGKASDLWKNDEKLVEKLKELLNSDRTDQREAADGILWRFLNESRFIAEQSSDQRILQTSRKHIEDIEDTDEMVWVKVNTDNGSRVCLKANLTEEDRARIAVQRIQSAKPKKKSDTPYKYDLMISYCHQDKGVCDILYECLSKFKKYAVWFDKKNMHGSMMERMAEAIEESHIVLICMSNSYKMSQACQSEGEYAYTRKRDMIFLKIEPNYKPNGWLGLLLRQNFYIDVSKTNFMTVLKNLSEQISLRRNEAPDLALIDGIVTPQIESSVANLLMKTKKETILSPTMAIPASQAETADKHSNSNLVPSSMPTESAPSGSTSKGNSSSKEAVFIKISPMPTSNKESLNTKYPLIAAANTSTKPIRYAAISSQQLPSINSSQKSSKPNTPMPSSYEQYVEQPEDRSISNEDPCTVEELTDLYPSDFEYSSESDREIRLTYSDGKTRKCSISSISDDDDDFTRYPQSNSALQIRSAASKEMTSPIPKSKITTLNPLRTSKSIQESKTSTETIITTARFRTKPVDEWAHEDVHEFIKQHHLFNMYPLLGELNGKRLLEIYQMAKPTSSQALTDLKKKLTTSTVSNISLHEFERFQHELKKLLPPSTENDRLFCTLM